MSKLFTVKESVYNIITCA